MRWWESQDTERLEESAAWLAKILAGAGLAVIGRFVQQWVAARAIPQKLASQILESTDSQNTQTLRGTVEETATQLRIHAELREQSEKTTEVRFTEVRNDICTLRSEMTQALDALRKESAAREERQDERIDRLVGSFTQFKEES